jgi:hypothetical protein
MDLSGLLSAVNQFNQGYIVLALALLSVFILIWVLVLTSSVNKLKKRLNLLMQDDHASDLGEALRRYADQLAQQQAATSKLVARADQLERHSKRNINGIGMVRFNAFPEVGSDLSFAVALMDGTGKGMVISSIYGRDENRIYAKPLENAQSSYRLSVEEQEAVDIARDRQVV